MEPTVKDSMSKNLVTVLWNEKLHPAYKKMKELKIRHLPVVDRNGELLGIISDRDFQRALLPSSYDFECYVAEDADFAPDSTVAEYMSWPVKTVSQDASLKDVALSMITDKVSAYIVTEDRTFTGIITSEDMLRALANLLTTTISDEKDIDFRKIVNGIQTAFSGVFERHS